MPDMFSEVRKKISTVVVLELHFLAIILTIIEKKCGQIDEFGQIWQRPAKLNINLTH